ncbi:5110_t:CDS:1, partial [Gigaspora margarita]
MKSACQYPLFSEFHVVLSKIITIFVCAAYFLTVAHASEKVAK